MSGDNGWFQQNCDPSAPAGGQQQEVPSGGGPVNTGADGSTPAQKTVNQVIENLLGQCYPSQAPQTIRNFVPEDDDRGGDGATQDFDFGFLIDRLNDLGLDTPNVPSKVQFSFPGVRNPTSGNVCLNDGEDTRSPVECKEDFEFKECIKDHIDCIFRPYAGGAWKPPQADCDVFSPKSDFGVTNRVCVRNCVPPRVPIFEHVSQGGAVDGAYNHSYALSENTPPGYITQPGATFYIHPGEQPKAVPLYIAYSSVKQDTMLTTDPGGNREQGKMDQAGFGPNSIIGYVYEQKSDIISALGEGERAAALYRYYNPVTFDHRYTLTPIGGAPLEARLEKGFYDLRHEVDADIKIEFNCQRGSAGYENTFGYYLTDVDNDHDPVYGQIVLKNATDATGYRSFTIPAATINQYVPCRLGFVLIPDGNQENGGISTGDTLTFSETSNGWRTNLSSAENNLSLFSEKRLNWNEKDFTKWTSRWWQYWEDLLDGDDDYDDVKISYRINYANSDWYYEGIQCYVFEDMIVPEYMDLSYANNCDGNLFEPAGFSDAQIVRTGCGSINEEGFGCGKCEGDYTTQRNRVQTITAKASGTVTIRSHGGMTGGYGECTKFTWKLEKNGTQIYSEKSKVEAWQKIGEVLHTFSVVEGDDITFSITEINSGHSNASVSPAFSLRDENTGDIFATWTVMLSTVSHSMSGVNNANCGKPAELKLVDLKDKSNNVVAWTVGGGVTNNWLETTNRPRYVEGTKKAKDGDTGIMMRSIEGGLAFQVQYEVLSASQMTNASAITFDSNGNIVNTGGTTTTQIKLEWDDRTSVAGLAITEITAVDADGQTVTWDRDDNRNSGKVTKSIKLPNGTTNVTYSGNSGGFSIKDNNSRVCLRDTDGNDCNADFKLGQGDGGIRYKVTNVYSNMSAGGYKQNQLNKWYVGTDKQGEGEKFYQGMRVSAIDGAECTSFGRINTVKFGSQNESAQEGDYGLVPPERIINALALQTAEYESNFTTLVEHLFTTDLRDDSSSVSDYYGEPVTLVQYWMRKTGNGEPVYFYHDFVLKANTSNDYATIRMRAQLVFKDELLDNGSPETNTGYLFVWTVDSIRDQGKGYVDGQTIRVTWPRKDEDDPLFLGGYEDDAPFYPEQNKLPKRIKIKNAETNAVSRTAKWAMYQESHDRSSTVWYSNLSRSKSAQFRTFRFIIEDAV